MRGGAEFAEGAQREGLEADKPKRARQDEDCERQNCLPAKRFLEEQDKRREVNRQSEEAYGQTEDVSPAAAQNFVAVRFGPATGHTAPLQRVPGEISRNAKGDGKQQPDKKPLARRKSVARWLDFALRHGATIAK